MWPGRAFIVGENGPEMFMPRSRGDVLPSDVTSALGSRTTVVNMTVRANDPNEFRASRAQMLADARRSARMRG